MFIERTSCDDGLRATIYKGEKLKVSVSVYLNNLQVQFVQGSRGKKGSYQESLILDAPEGSIINGIITDAPSFITFLKETWEFYRFSRTDVHLVVGGNKIHGRSVDVPVLSAAKTKQFLSRELSDMEKEGEEYVLCYNVLSGSPGKKLKKYYVEMADSELIHDYVDIFKEAGITLKSLVSAEGAIISLVDKTVTSSYKTFIMQIMNGNIVTNILWVDGCFNYYNSTRCFNDVGTSAYFEDCARSLSNLNQFMQAHKIEQPVERILIAGTEYSDMGFYGDIVSAYGLNAPVSVLNQGLGSNADKNFKAQQVIFGLSGLYTDGTKESNFLAGMNNKDKESKAINPELRKNIMIVGITLAVMAIAFLAVFMLRMSRQIVYDDLVEYNEDPLVISKTTMFDSFSKRRDTLASRANSIRNVLNTINTYPVLTPEVESVLYRTASGYADITIGSFDAENGLVNVTATAKDVELINQYIYRLQEQDIFNSVEYSGYNYNQDGTWSINVICTFAQSVGREGVNDEK